MGWKWIVVSFYVKAIRVGLNNDTEYECMLKFLLFQLHHVRMLDDKDPPPNPKERFNPQTQLTDRSTIERGTP